MNKSIFLIVSIYVTFFTAHLFADKTYHYHFEDINFDNQAKVVERPQISDWQFNSYYHIHKADEFNLKAPQGENVLYLHSGKASKIIENIRPNHIYSVKLALAANDAYSAQNSFIAIQAVKNGTFDTVAYVRFSDILDINAPTEFKYTSLNFDASTREDLKGYPLRIVIESASMIHLDDIQLNITPNSSSNILTLENDYVSFVFLGQNRGLTSIYDKVAAVEHINRVPGAGFYDKPLKSTLWNINYVSGNKRDYLSSCDFPASAGDIQSDSKGNQIATIRWQNLSLKDSPKSVDVEVVVTLPVDSGIASWEIKVNNKSKLWGLDNLKFPIVTGLLEAEKYDIAAPRKNIGINHKNCNERLFFEYGEGWWGPGQFMCADLDGNSVYMATHDDSGWPKNFVCEPGKEFHVQSYPKNMSVIGSGFDAPYPMMLGVYQGNWLDCCKIYREFAINNARWCSYGNNETAHKDIKDIGIWTIYSADEAKQTTVEEITKPIYELQKALDTKIGVHWYNWHSNIFDYQLPHYMPAKPLIAESIREFADNDNILIMPYINARVISFDIEDLDDYKPYLCKDKNGDFYNELYGGAPNTLVMCPHTQMWQDKVYEITKQVVNELKVSSIYLDQVSGAPIKLCYADNHGHPIGGGDWWVESYHKMLAKLKTITDHRGNPISVTTEFAAEPYIGATDNFLIWMAREPHDIPMLPAVYSDYTFYFGSNNYEPDEQTWNLIQLRSAIWGIQNGWMSPEFILDSQNPFRIETMRKIIDFRKQAQNYLVGAELIDIVDSSETINVTWAAENIDLPDMQATIWKYKENKLGVFIANFSNSENVFTLDIPLSKYKMNTASRYKILSNDNITDLTVENSTLKIERTIGSNDIDFCEIIAYNLP